MSKKLSAGKSTPGVCCDICPADTRLGDSFMVTGPNTDELPVRFMATISVWMVVRPPGPQPMHGFWRCTVEGPETVTLSVPRPFTVMVTLATVLRVSVPAAGNTHPVGV